MVLTNLLLAEPCSKSCLHHILRRRELICDQDTAGRQIARTHALWTNTRSHATTCYSLSLAQLAASITFCVGGSYHGQDTAGEQFAAQNRPTGRGTAHSQQTPRIIGSTLPIFVTFNLGQAISDIYRINISIGYHRIKKSKWEPSNVTGSHFDLEIR